ncbi:hypothetical protein TNCV_9681 [Trichonephila clavipes]|nr:hypothetical protein TNCV_9681 [Trichonephila clavipes]
MVWVVWEFPRFGSQLTARDIPPLTPVQSEKLIVFRKRILQNTELETESEVRRDYMDMVDAAESRGGLDYLGLGSAQSVFSLSKSGCMPFYSTTIYTQNSRTDYLSLSTYLPLDWSRTSAELSHKDHCLWKRGKSGDATRNCYESNDPSRRENVFGSSLAEEFNPSVIGKRETNSTKLSSKF